MLVFLFLTFWICYFNAMWWHLYESNYSVSLLIIFMCCFLGTLLHLCHVIHYTKFMDISLNFRPTENSWSYVDILTWPIIIMELLILSTINIAKMTRLYSLFIDHTSYERVWIKYFVSVKWNWRIIQEYMLGL